MLDNRLPVYYLYKRADILPVSCSSDALRVFGLFCASILALPYSVFDTELMERNIWYPQLALYYMFKYWSYLHLYTYREASSPMVALSLGIDYVLSEN